MIHQGAVLHCPVPSYPWSSQTGRGSVSILDVVRIYMCNCDLARYSYTGLNLRSCILTRVFQAAHIRFMNTLLPQTLPNFLPWYPVVAFTRCNSFRIYRCLSITCFAANIAPVVPLPGMKPICYSPMLVSSLSLLSTILSQIFMVCDIILMPL